MSAAAMGLDVACETETSAAMFVVGGFATFVAAAAVVICLRFNMQINIIGHTMLFK